MQDRRVPPQEQVFVGAGDFVTVGREFFGYFKELGGLRPTDLVLDVGSGQGRMALPLTNWLSADSHYVGIEIVGDAVVWCRKAYSKFPNFSFVHADVYNKKYNPQGRQAASAYQFPCKDKTFDFVFLTSVFTHMCPEEVENYVYEISRCLKPGGRCLLTFFLLNDESLAGIDSGQSTQPFCHEIFDVCRVTKINDAEAAIAYDEQHVRGLLASRGLGLVGNIYYGNWVTRCNSLSYQDILIVEKLVDKK